MTLTCSATTTHRAGGYSAGEVVTATAWVLLPSWAAVGLLLAGTTAGTTAAGCLAVVPVALVASAVVLPGDGEM